MSDLYSSPEQFGLATIGEIQWGVASWDFDLTVVWKRELDGAFVYGEDSGCSCPSPFEDTSLGDLKRATPLAEFQAHLNERNAQQIPWGDGDQAADIAELLERMHAAGAR